MSGPVDRPGPGPAEPTGGPPRLVHPSPEIPQELVDKIVGRRGRLHVIDEIDPERTALVVIDMDVGSCAREPELTAIAIDKINAVSVALRNAGGTVAFVTSTIVDQAELASRLGPQRAAEYHRETRPGAIGTVLAPSMVVAPQDLVATKTGASAFFPGRCHLDDELQGRGIAFLLIAGLVTNVCCESSARDACELGYRVTMVSDANVGHSFGLHEASLATFFRIFGDVRPAADVVGLIERSTPRPPTS